MSFKDRKWKQACDLFWGFPKVTIWNSIKGKKIVELMYFFERHGENTVPVAIDNRWVTLGRRSSRLLATLRGLSMWLRASILIVARALVGRRFASTALGRRGGKLNWKLTTTIEIGKSKYSPYNHCVLALFFESCDPDDVGWAWGHPSHAYFSPPYSNKYTKKWSHLTLFRFRVSG